MTNFTSSQYSVPPKAQDIIPTKLSMNTTPSSFFNTVCTPSMINCMINKTTNSSLHPYLGDMGPLQFVTIIVCVLIFIIGILGNSLVLVVFGSRFSKIKACELFLTNLALADLLGSIVLPGDKLYQLSGGNYRNIGHGGCKSIHFFTITSISVSAITLIAISFDRYVIVRWPLRRRMNMRYLIGVSGLIWILGSLPGIPYVMRENIKLHVVDNKTQFMICRGFMEMEEHIIHTLITFSIQVVIPLITMTLTYSLIVHELRKITKTQVFQNHERVTRSRFKRNRKTVKLLFVVVASFFLCIAPVNIFYLLYLYKKHGLSVEKTDHVFSILLMIQMANSCVNPIIYSKLHTSFRRTTLSIFCSCCISNFSTFKSTLSTFASTRISRFSRTSNYTFAKHNNGKNSPDRNSPKTVANSLNRMAYLTPEDTPRMTKSSEAICMEEIKEKDLLLTKVI